MLLPRSRHFCVVCILAKRGCYAVSSLLHALLPGYSGLAAKVIACRAGSKSCYGTKESKPPVSEGSLGTGTQLQRDLWQTPPDNHCGGGSQRYGGARLDSVLDGWGKQVIRDPSHLQASTRSKSQTVPWPFQVLLFLPHSHLVSSPAALIFASGDTAITFFMFFKHFTLYLLLAGWLPSPGEGPTYD